MIGKLKDMARSRDGREWVISFTTPLDFSEQFDQLADKVVDVEIKQHRDKRSLDANAFAWVLIDKIASKMSLKKTDVYLNTIKEIGGITGYVGVKDEFVDTYIEAWKSGHIGRDAWVIPGSSKPGWSTIKVRLGSSDFDTLQMSRLIDLLIQDAESLGIPTITDDELQKIKGCWKKGE